MDTLDLIKSHISTSFENIQVKYLELFCMYDLIKNEYFSTF